MPASRKPILPEEFDGNFIREIESTYRGNKKDRRVELLCQVCNKVFIAIYSNAKRTKQKSCSNQCGGVLTRKNENYVAETHPLYTVWLSIKDRCNNPNNERFSRYGARGISLSAELNTFDAFFSYVSSLPNYPYTNSLKVCKNISIDRIDSDKDYTVGNLRWADVYTQAANKTWKKPNSTSSYKGVCYCKTYHVWVAKVQWQKKIHCVYRGSSEQEAYEARKAFIQKHNLPHHY